MRKGFTLIELMIVMSIIGILMSLFIPLLVNKTQGRSEVPTTLPTVMEVVHQVAKEDRSGTSDPIAVTNGYEIRVEFEYDGVRIYSFHKGEYNNFNPVRYFSKEIK